MHYRIESVEPLPNAHLLVHFLNGTVKIYDFNKLIKSWDVFAPLSNPFLFNHVQVSHGGYGVEWNDELDMSCNDLWFDGVEVEEEEQKVTVG